MAVKEYRLHLLVLDDDSVVCVHHGQAAMLSKVAVGCAQRLLDFIEPARNKQFEITPPARSAELALKANGPAGGGKYAMTKNMVTMLNSIATLNDPVTTADIVTLLSWKAGTVSSKLSMLTTNGYLVRTDIGKYMASPEGQLFLRDHVAN